MAQLPSKQIPVSDIDKAFIDKQFTLLANVDSRLGKVLNYVVAIAAVIGGGLLLYAAHIKAGYASVLGIFTFLIVVPVLCRLIIYLGQRKDRRGIRSLEKYTITGPLKVNFSAQAMGGKTSSARINIGIDKGPRLNYFGYELGTNGFKLLKFGQYLMPFNKQKTTMEYLRINSKLLCPIKFTLPDQTIDFITQFAKYKHAKE
jgi:hypothetical protein